MQRLPLKKIKAAGIFKASFFFFQAKEKNIVI